MTKSVALCTYNGEAFLKDQLDSILNQTINVDEIIICDDISTDNTIKIINDYILKYPNLIKLYINETKLFTVKNFEKAIKLCTGDIIFLSDQDDIWIENKVEIIIEEFTNKKEIKAVATNGHLINENNQELDLYAVWDVFSFMDVENIKYNYFDILVHVGNFATGATMAFKKELINEIIPLPIIKDFYHDEYIAIISSNKNNFSFINDKLIKYRLHKNQQVGGVSYKKDEKTKRLVQTLFTLNKNEENFNLKNGKSKLKKLVNCFNKWNNIYHSENKFIFKFILQKIELDFYIIKCILFEKYPLKFAIINFFDKKNKKRQLKY